MWETDLEFCHMEAGIEFVRFNELPQRVGRKDKNRTCKCV